MKKTNIETSLELLHNYKLGEQQYNTISKQVIGVIIELEGIDEPINHREIIEEVISQNLDIEKTVNGETRSLKIRFSGQNLKLVNQPINHLEIDIKFSGMTIDLREFNFAGGALTIDVKTLTSGMEILINDNVEISQFAHLNLSGVSFTNGATTTDNFSDLPSTYYSEKIILQGDMRLSGIEFIISPRCNN